MDSHANSFYNKSKQKLTFQANQYNNTGLNIIQIDMATGTDGRALRKIRSESLTGEQAEELSLTLGGLDRGIEELTAQLANVGEARAVPADIFDRIPELINVLKTALQVILDENPDLFARLSPFLGRRYYQMQVAIPPSNGSYIYTAEARAGLEALVSYRQDFVAEFGELESTRLVTETIPPAEKGAEVAVAQAVQADVGRAVPVDPVTLSNVAPIETATDPAVDGLDIPDDVQQILTTYGAAADDLAIKNQPALPADFDHLLAGFMPPSGKAN